jgi:hypothetical protein
MADGRSLLYAVYPPATIFIDRSGQISRFPDRVSTFLLPMEVQQALTEELLKIWSGWWWTRRARPQQARERQKSQIG